MLGLILRLREPLSEKGRAEFVHATILSCVAGVVRGLSLVAFIPAAIALTGGGPAWGMPLGFWLVALALCAVVSFVVEYLLSMRSYSVSFDFLSNMHRAIGDKVASLPLGSVRADTAGKTSRFDFASNEMLYIDWLGNFTNNELRLMRNEIYARHGYRFSTPDMQEYFSACPWYSPRDNNDAAVAELSEIEKINVQQIKRAEKQKIMNGQ